MTVNEKEGPWIGASGSEYNYYIFDIDEEIPARIGNFIYAKKNEENLWVPIYMGFGDLAVRCTGDRLVACIMDKGATHVHLRLNGMQEVCKQELQDLLERYENAFPPDGCNDMASFKVVEAPASRER